MWRILDFKLTTGLVANKVDQEVKKKDDILFFDQWNIVVDSKKRDV